MAEIRFERVTKRFGNNEVVKELDLTVRDGEFFTFVGPSGCGKSTVLNMIAGLETVSSGSVRFDGRTVDRLSPRERDVAMVFQSYALYPHLTVFGNIAFPLRMQKERKQVVESEVRRVAGLLGLEGLLDRRPKELSGGQRQRVALGRAIIRKPKVFLMDEPLSNLDARLRIEMRAELKRLHRELGITTVYVTHDQAEAMGLSDRVAVLERGVMQQCDAPREIYRRPANVFVAGFIGSPPMNFLRCDVVQPQPLTVDCGGRRLRVGTERQPEGKEVVIGIRPEDAAVRTERRPGDMEATVSVVEPAGPVVWVDVQWQGSRVTAAASTDEVFAPGDAVGLAFDEGKAAAFDAATGARL